MQDKDNDDRDTIVDAAGDALKQIVDDAGDALRSLLPSAPSNPHDDD